LSSSYLRLAHHNTINTTPPAIAPRAWGHTPGTPVGAAAALLELVFLLEVSVVADFVLITDELVLLEIKLLDVDIEELKLELDILLLELDSVATLVRGIVVDIPLTTTWVIPLITVVLPDTEKLGFTGIVVRPPVRISCVVPPITVKPWTVGLGAATVVAPGTTRKGVPLIIVVIPVRPGGAFTKGIEVGPGITRKGVPPIFVVGKACGNAAGIVVGPGTTRNGVPLIITVLPWRPGGAWFTGIVVAPGTTIGAMGFAGSVVGPGTTTKVVPSISTVLPWSPGGAWFKGIVVAAGITRGCCNGVPAGWAGIVVGPFTIITGVPSTRTVLPTNPAGATATGIVVAPGITSGGWAGDPGAGIVVGLLTMITGVLSMMTVLPTNPGGASTTGIVVGLMTTGVLTGFAPGVNVCGESVGSPFPLKMEKIIPPSGFGVGSAGFGTTGFDPRITGTVNGDSGGVGGTSTTGAGVTTGFGGTTGGFCGTDCIWSSGSGFAGIRGGAEWPGAVT